MKWHFPLENSVFGSMWHFYLCKEGSSFPSDHAVDPMSQAVQLSTVTHYWDAKPEFKCENENEVFLAVDLLILNNLQRRLRHVVQWEVTRYKASTNATSNIPPLIAQFNAPDEPADKTLGLEQRPSPAVWQLEKISWHSSFFVQLATFYSFSPRSKTGPQTNTSQGTLQSQER